MTRAELGSRVNIKYNHASKTKVILNENSIPPSEIQINLCEPITSVSSSKFYKIISLIYIVPLLKVSKCYIPIIIFLLKILFSMVSVV